MLRISITMITITITIVVSLFTLLREKILDGCLQLVCVYSNDYCSNTSTSNTNTDANTAYSLLIVL